MLPREGPRWYGLWIGPRVECCRERSLLLDVCPLVENIYISFDEWRSGCHHGGTEGEQPPCHPHIPSIYLGVDKARKLESSKQDLIPHWSGASQQATSGAPSQKQASYLAI